MTSLESAAIDYVRLRRYVDGLRYGQQWIYGPQVTKARKRLEREADLLLSVYTETEKT